MIYLSIICWTKIMIPWEYPSLGSLKKNTWTSGWPCSSGPQQFQIPSCKSANVNDWWKLRFKIQSVEHFLANGIDQTGGKSEKNNDSIFAMVSQSRVGLSEEPAACESLPRCWHGSPRANLIPCSHRSSRCPAIVRSTTKLVTGVTAVTAVSEDPEFSFDLQGSQKIEDPIPMD